jgi:Y_Y_Y domain/Two component regulator propeller
VADQGLFVLVNRKFVRLPIFSNSFSPANPYFGSINEFDRFFLIGTWEEKGKLLLYDKVEKKVTDIDSSLSIYNIVIGGPGKEIFISTPKGIFTLDKETLSYGRILMKKIPDINEKLNITVWGIFFDKENNRWLYNNNAIAKSKSNGTFEVISRRQGLDANNISALFIDREGILWIATDRSGVLKLANTNVSLLNSLNGDDRNYISAIQCVGDTIWLCDVDKNHIMNISPNGSQIYTPDEAHLYKNIFVTGDSIYLNDDRKVYLAKQKNKPYYYKHPEVIYSSNNSRITFGKAAMDKYGSLHFSAKTDSVNYILTITKQRKTFLYKVDGFVDKLICDQNNKLWAITRNSDLLVFSLHPDDSKSYLTVLHNYKAELPSINPRTFAIDTDQNIWVGTRSNGVYILKMNNLKLKSFGQLSVKDGLTDNFIYSIACDKNNNVWSGSQNGLDKISFQNGHYIIENTSRINNIFETVVSVNIDSLNNVWALCNQGNIIRVENNEDQRSSSTPSLFITGIKINGVTTEIKNLHETYIYKENSFSFAVAAPSFTDERSVTYCYLLEGNSNNNWSAPSNNSVFNFLNLPPGNYSLHLKAIFPTKIYPDEFTSYSFVILPP